MTAKLGTSSGAAMILIKGLGLERSIWKGLELRWFSLKRKLLKHGSCTGDLKSCFVWHSVFLFVCLFVLNIWISCRTFKYWEITLWQSELPSFLRVNNELEMSSRPFFEGPVLSNCMQSPPHSAPMPCNYQLLSLLTQLFSSHEKALSGWYYSK